MKKIILNFIILLAIIYPLYIVYHINKDFHKLIMEAKQIEAIDLVSHMIHSMDQSKHIGHNHTKDKNIHLIHNPNDVVDFNLEKALFYEIFREHISDLRVNNATVIDINKNVLLSTLDTPDTFKTSTCIKYVLDTKKPFTKMIHHSNKFLNFFMSADHIVNRTMEKDVVKVYVPILFGTETNYEITGVVEIVFDIDILAEAFNDLTFESIMILLGPLFIIMIMGYYSFERRKVNLSLQKSEDNLLEAQRIAKIGNWVWDIETDEITWTKEAYNIFEREQGSYASYQIFLERVHPEHREYVKDEVNKTIKTGNNYQTIHKLNSDKLKWIKEIGKIYYNSDNNPIKMIGTSQDITESKVKELTLIESEEKFRLVTQSTHDAIVGIDEEGNVMFWNPGAIDVFGYKEEEIIGGSFLSLLPESYIGGYSEVCDKAITVADSFFVVDEKDIELYGMKRDGTEFPMQVTLTIWPFKKKKIYSAIIKDITERRKFQNKLLYQANYDKLTSLPNRNMIDDRIKQAEITARRNNTKAAVMFIDLDRFKYVNDTFGHDAGDDLLVQVSKRLQSCVREVDTVARLGGDEFLIILSDVKKPIGVRLIAKKILTQLSSKFELSDIADSVNISCSIGIAFYPDDGIGKDELLKKADAAMYQAKYTGKNNYKFYTSELDDENNTKLQIERELRTALENNEFYMVYQPIMCMKTETITGVETLLRWNNPTLGIVPPDIFIPIAEEIGLMPELGSWILRTSCTEMNNIVDDESDIYLSINVSVAQLENPNFPNLMNSIIKESSFPAELIQLEITESMMMKNIEKSIEIMVKLTNIGVSIAIDDFGTGYSSFSYLKKIKASTLKIDKSFIDDVPDDEEDVAIVRAITRMAQSLNLKIVAEGIEEVSQAEFLKELECDRGQGYLYYKPMVIGEFVKTFYEV